MTAVTALVPPQGTTTQSESPYHEYEIDEDGKGVTTRVVSLTNGGEVAEHEHAIYDYAVVPLGVTTSISTASSRENLKSAESAEVTTRLNKYLEKSIIDTADFKILDFCFNLNDAALFWFIA